MRPASFTHSNANSPPLSPRSHQLTLSRVSGPQSLPHHPPLRPPRSEKPRGVRDDFEQMIAYIEERRIMLVPVLITTSAKSLPGMPQTECKSCRWAEAGWNITRSWPAEHCTNVRRPIWTAAPGNSTDLDHSPRTLSSTHRHLQLNPLRRNCISLANSQADSQAGQHRVRKWWLVARAT